VRAYLATPDNDLRVLRLPTYSPDFNAEEAIWAWVREAVTANTCLGTQAKVQEKLAQFFDGLQTRTAGVQRRCRTKLQALAEELVSAPPDHTLGAHHVDPTWALQRISS
jgi:transposase